MTHHRFPVHQRDFTLLWVGQAISQFGSRGYGVAIMLWVLAASNSPATVGLVSSVTLGALTVATIPAGWIVDRFDRRRTMIAADACSAVATGSLALSAWAGSFYLAPVLLAVAVLGIGWAVRGLAEDAALPHVVDTRELSAAFALIEARGYAAGVAGPPLAAALYGVSAALPFAADAVTYVAAGTSAALVRRPLQEKSEPGPVTSNPIAVSAGLRFFWQQPFIRTTAALSAVGEFVVNGCGLVTVVLLARSGAAPALIGVALAVAYAAGMVGALATPLARRYLSVHTLLVLSASVGAVTVLALAYGSPVVATFAYAGLLLVQPTWQILIATRYVHLVADELRGRVLAAVGLVTSLPVMLAPIAIGVLVTMLGTSSTCQLLAAALAAVALATATNPTIRKTLRTPAVGSAGH